MRMRTLGLPNQAILEALGQLSVRHGQLEYCLKMMIKSLINLNIEDVLIQTDKKKASDIRKQILSEGTKKITDPIALEELTDLINRSWVASDKRNSLIHNLWALDISTNACELQNDDFSWRAAPLPEEIHQLADTVYQIILELNESRISGNIFKALEVKVT